MLSPMDYYVPVTCGDPEALETVQRKFEEISLVLIFTLSGLTCLLVDFLIRLNNRAKAVEHQCSQFGGTAL